MDVSKNVRGGNLEICCRSPKTGYYRNGSCETGSTDFGTHVICAQVTEEFLNFTKQRGNDLSTPSPAGRFPGLNPGDKWCLCASRWKEALDAGIAPPVLLPATHAKALKYVTLRDLELHSIEGKQ